MTDKRQALSLPDIVGEETLVNIQEKVNEVTRAEGRKSDQGLFTRREIRKDDLLYRVGEVPDAIYMLNGGTMLLENIDGRASGKMPVTTSYHAVPGRAANQPILGARYFFDRRPVTIAYRAQTPCAFYAITSQSLERLYQIDTESVLQIMYWMLVCSDLTDGFIPVALRALGSPSGPIEDSQELFRAVEEFRVARSHPKMGKVLGYFYDKFKDRRKGRAEELGIESSIA